MNRMYEYHCSAPDSTGHAHDAEDFLKCDGCGQLLCRLHASSPLALPYWHFCEACFRCARCGETAWAACEECGDLRCREHTFIQEGELDGEGWPAGDASYSCHDVCNCVLERRRARSYTGGRQPKSGVA